ncbi:hypothetical protein SK128_019558 [Halocaridina rubra]|uniref:Uncharacterized protein n=1 Tax=Halocaridina rubra TaxID=373956 RepID=A0AAN8WGN7_HALRR
MDQNLHIKKTFIEKEIIICESVMSSLRLSECDSELVPAHQVLSQLQHHQGQNVALVSQNFENVLEDFANKLEASVVSAYNGSPFLDSPATSSPDLSWIEQQEVLEDVTTWSQEPVKTTTEAFHEAGAFNLTSDIGGEVNSLNRKSPIAVAEDTSVPKSSLCNISSKPSTVCSYLSKRKLKAYQWPPQTDPAREAKRLRAIKAYKNRLLQEKNERAMNIELKILTRQVSDLEKEKANLLQRIEQLTN